jgi:hypothetical protein
MKTPPGMPPVGVFHDPPTASPLVAGSVPCHRKRTIPRSRQDQAGKISRGQSGRESESWIHLLYEGGPQGGGTFARFNLSWLPEGEATGDGQTPDWIRGD